jgi:drug/metabolite transporter (DMT)-like permease
MPGPSLPNTGTASMDARAVVNWRSSDFAAAGLAAPGARAMNIIKAILLKIASAFLFAVMSVLVRYLGDRYPVGQVVFYRSAFAILPVVIIYAWRGELEAAIRMGRPFAHIGRGLTAVGAMFCNFSALARLPVVDATAISFVSPLFTVAMSALILKERVRVYRWSAVIIGFSGVLVMLSPYLDVGGASATEAGMIGAMLGLAGAVFAAGSTIQTRALTASETTSSIVLYFSLICTLAGLVTWPFGWITPSWPELAALIVIGICGGLAHILLTESYRLAPASLVAPFDYTSMLWALVLGFLVFGEVPAILVFVGAAIIAGAGLFVIWRERQLGLQRARAAEGPPTGT